MKKIISLVYIIISYVVFFVAVDKLSFLHFSYDLLLLFSIANIFILLHFILNIKKMYQFIYEKRYVLGILVFLFLVLLEYNGTSSQIWNYTIQPNNQITNSVILGKPRPIRSDEWLVSTPMTLTQATTIVNFSDNNIIMGATDNNVTLYPNLPSKDISILATPNNIGYLFLDKEKAFSFSWYFVYFLLFFATFEMFMILSNKKKIYSLIGAVMITFSPVVQWWQSPNIIAYGSLAVVLFYYLIRENNKLKKILLSIIFGYSGFLYIMCLYPAWQIPYGYCYLIILIWVLVKNKKHLCLSDLIYLIPIFAVIGCLMFIIFKNNIDTFKIMNSTVYPGARLSTGGGEWRTLFSYIIQIFYPYKEIGNPCEFSQYISLFPVPLLYGIYIMIKNKKKDLFIILCSLVTILLFIWICFPLPEFISKISLIYMSTEMRAQVAIGYLSVIELIYIITNYEEKNIINIKKILLISMISVVIMYLTISISNSVLESYFPGYINIYTSILSFIIFFIIMVLVLLNNKNTNRILIIILFIISIISGAIVSPLNKGLEVYYEKPLSKQIKKITTEEPNSIFITVDSGIVLANYIAVSGARTINTVNYLPNLELYYLLDEERKYEHIYNRYEHVNVILIEDETSFHLNQDDYITIKLNYKDICKINVDYIVTMNENDILQKYDNIYNEDGIKIYKTNCK